MSVEDKFKKIKAKYDNAKKPKKKKKVILHTFKRTDFNKDLSTNLGFGFQDLTDDARALYRKMVCEYDDIIVLPKNTSKDKFSVEISIMV